MPFSFFDHTGDIGVRLSGRTLDEIFRSAAGALMETLTEPARVEPRQSMALALESSAADLLLVEWLNEILYRFEVNQFLVATVEARIEGRGRGQGGSDMAVAMQSTLVGETFDPDRHRLKALIKAVTYHALEVREDRDGWHATVVFDI